jgi:hypothetical protein
MYRDSRFLTITGQHVDGTPTSTLPAPKTEAALRARVPAEPPKGNGHAGDDESEWSKLNTEALEHLDLWVPDLFGSKAKRGRLGYRVSSKSLGRKLEEDLSLTPQGCKDWGVHDLGDERQGKRSPIDVVMEHGGKTFSEAVSWLEAKLPSMEAKIRERAENAELAASLSASFADKRAKTQAQTNRPTDTLDETPGEPSLDTADIGTAIEFLQWLRPGCGPWVLTATVPDGAIPAITITASSTKEATDFIGTHNGKRNLHFTANPTRGAMSNKPVKTDIDVIRFLHADFNPNDGEIAEDAKARYQAQLDNNEPIPPSALWDTGNGLQGLWRLRESIVLGKPEQEGKFSYRFHIRMT